jgi:hypothetical protein
MKEAVAIGLGVVGLLVVGGGVALAASSSSSSSTPSAGAGGASGGTSGSAGASGPSSLPAGSTQGLMGSHSTPSGWELDITASSTSGLIYSAFFGDVVRVSLPAGAHWRKVTAAGDPPALSPPSGTDAFVFQFVEPMAYTLAYTDVSGVDVTTVMSLELGGTFAKTTHLTTGDYVILAVAVSDFQSAFSGLSAALSAPATADPVLAQQGETINTAAAALKAAQGSSAPLTTAEVLTLFFAMGPWASAFGIDVRTFVPFASGTTLPSWWPSDDTAAATEHHVLYRYIGAGVDVSALPFPVTAWKRTA